MYYDKNIINEVLKQNRIENIVSQYTELRKFGNLQIGRCPFEKDTTFNLIIDTTSQTFQCLSCGKGGNVISFIMEINNCDFVNALERLAKGKMFLPTANKLESDDMRTLKNSILKINRDAQKYFSSTLQKNDKGMKYFEKRELSDKIIHQFQLGMSDTYGDALYQMLSLKYTQHELNESGLFFGRDGKMYDKFWDRVMFPVHDENGNIVGFGGRVLGDGKPKYLNSPETKLFIKGNILYGYNIAKNSKHDSLILCEGYMDVISMHQAGYNNAVASLGTSLTVQQAKLIAKKTNRVYIAYDEDAPGIAATKRALDILEAEGLIPKVLNFGIYKDPDEFIKAQGSDALENVVKNSESPDHFRARVINKTGLEYFEEASDILMKYL